MFHDIGLTQKATERAGFASTWKVRMPHATFCKATASLKEISRKFERPSLSTRPQAIPEYMPRRSFQQPRRDQFRIFQQPASYRRFAGGTARPDFGGKMGNDCRMIAFYGLLESAVARVEEPAVMVEQPLSSDRETALAPSAPAQRASPEMLRAVRRPWLGITLVRCAILLAAGVLVGPVRYAMGPLGWPGGSAGHG